METGIVLFEGYPVRYYEEGKGPALVFLHGYLESLNIWSPFIKGFPAGFRIVSIDLPGHGQSGVPGPVSTMDEMARAVISILDHLGITNCFVVGHSMGGYTALALLEHHAGRLNGISLFHSHTLADSAAVIEKRHREISIVEQGHSNLLVQQNIPNMFAEETLDSFAEELQFTQRIARQTTDAGIIAAIRGLMARPDRSAVLASARVPCLQIIGKKDKYIAFEEVSMQTVLPAGSERLILEHSGHMGFFEEKELAMRGILTFLQRI